MNDKQNDELSTKSDIYKEESDRLKQATLTPVSKNVELNPYSQLVDNDTGVEDELIIGLSTFDRFDDD